MKRVLPVRVESLEEGLTQFRHAWQAGRFRGELVTFETMADMARTLTPSRFELLHTLQAQGPMTLRALARLLKRDVKSVHRDVTSSSLDWSKATRTGSRFRTMRSGRNSPCDADKSGLIR